MLELGIDEAIMIGELASEYDYWDSKEQLDEDGFFYSTVENVEENTTLTKYKQKKALDNLQKLGLVEVKRKGLPAKRYIKINEEQLMGILSNKKSKNLTSRSQKISQLEVKKFDLNNNKDNNNKNNKKEINKEKKSKQKKEKTDKRFSPPTVQQVKDYCLERGNNINPEKFVAFYQSKGWKIGKSPMTDWKSAVRTWELNNTTPQNNATLTTEDVSYDINEYENTNMLELLGY